MGVNLPILYWGDSLGTAAPFFGSAAAGIRSRRVGCLRAWGHLAETGA